MNFKPIVYINGVLLLILSAAMVFPVLLDFSADNQDWRVFAGAQAVTAFFGFCMVFSTQQRSFTLTLKETFVLTCMSWFMLCIFSALPFYFSSIGLSFAGAVFEATSGITTTGSTVIASLNDLPKGILLWRSLLQWIGGIGVLVIALAVLPLLQISGMQIYKSQSFGEIDKVLPSATQIAFYILLIYAAMTLACTVMLHFAGMSLFDALNHGMTSVATGGFSTKDASIGHFNSPKIEAIVMFFMLLSALPYVLFVKFVRGDTRAVFKDSQVRAFLRLTAAAVVVFTFYLLLSGQFYFIDAVRHAAFSVVTLITTTGYAHADYSNWGPFAVGFAFFLTFLGACSGSTSGGMKTFRLQILWKMTQQQLNRLMSPHGIFQVHYNNKVVEPTIQAAIAGFFFVYIATWVLFGLLLQLTGLDYATAFSGALTAVSNVGPGLGTIIGPAGNFASLPDSALALLSAAMLLGRLEFFTVLVLLVPRFWRQ